MLDELLKIKRLREDDAIVALAKAQAFLEQKITERDAKQQEQAEYRTWRLAEGDRLYKKIYGQKIALSKLEELREKIGLFRQKDVQLEGEYLQMVEDVKSAQTALDEAKQKRIEAHKKVTKYEEYNQIRLTDEKRETERREEVELEDFVSKKP